MVLDLSYPEMFCKSKRNILSTMSLVTFLSPKYVANITVTCDLMLDDVIMTSQHTCFRLTISFEQFETS